MLLAAYFMNNIAVINYVVRNGTYNMHAIPLNQVCRNKLKS